MTTGNSPSFEIVDSALRQLGAADRATEAHGSLCGLACILGPRAPAIWVAGLAEECGDGRPGTEGEIRILGDLASSTCAALSQGDLSFALLLPPDDSPLAVRAEGLAGWCAGFMHGLGEAGGGRDTREALDTETSREIMEDFCDIARLTLEGEESDLEAESAYTELVEFVRVSVQLLFDELYDVRQRLAAAPLH